MPGCLDGPSLGSKQCDRRLTVFVSVKAIVEIKLNHVGFKPCAGQHLFAIDFLDSVTKDSRLLALVSRKDSTWQTRQTKDKLINRSQTHIPLDTLIDGETHE